MDSCDGYCAVFEWLSEHLEEVSIKLKEFIQKEYSAVRETDFSGARFGSASNNTYPACCMMYFAEWTSFNKWSFAVQKSCDGIDL